MIGGLGEKKSIFLVERPHETLVGDCLPVFIDSLTKSTSTFECL